VEIDFHGAIDGQPFEGGEACGFQLELGSGRLIAGFEDGLLGAKAADELGLDLTFPQDYPKAELAGKPVHFKVKMNGVSRPVLPEVNEEFFQQFGVREGGLEAFRREVRKNIEREGEQKVKAKVKTDVLEALYGANAVELPRVLVEAEAKNLAKDARQRILNLGIPDAQAGILEPKMFEEEAKKRVALGLIAAEVIRMAGLKADPARVRAAVEGIASSYENPAGIIAWYYADRKRLADIESLVLENEVVDWVLARARVTEYPTSFDALMNPRQTDSK
jgi:trigger factor